MRLSLIPHKVFDNYQNVTPAFLKEHGIKLLLCDLDFTLAPKSVSYPDEKVFRWISDLKKEDICVMILSNNRKPIRVEKFCSQLGIPYEGHASKPFGKGFTRAMDRVGVSPKETAMLGDKLLTDVLSAQFHDAMALMVEPLGGAVTTWQKVLHTLQAPFKMIASRRC